MMVGLTTIGGKERPLLANSSARSLSMFSECDFIFIRVTDKRFQFYYEAN